MIESSFRPNWASPPGQTIGTILASKGMTINELGEAIGISERDVLNLLAGCLPITDHIATGLAQAVGSTKHFWVAREKQYQEAVEAIQTRAPELERWFKTFPLKAMQELGWIPPAQSSKLVPSELLDFFGVSDISEWQDKYLSRLSRTQFRTSESFQNHVAATTAWLRRGELVADTIDCGQWDKDSFRAHLPELKGLTTHEDPAEFVPELQAHCARFGVAVVVVRCPKGCAASGATCFLDSGKALLLLSCRFLTDDQFWFSFFHEAGHLILHGDETYIEDDDNSSPTREAEANAFAQSIILGPEGETALQLLSINKFSVVRFAKRCGVSPGLIIGQLQHRKRVPPSSFNVFKVRYRHDALPSEMC
jgi:HTH-type transcriptional regulator/antitoxin HigA